MRIHWLMVIIMTLTLVGCTTESDADATAIATAEVGNAEGGVGATATVVSTTDGATPVVTDGSAPAADTAPNPPDDVSQDFFAAYTSDPSGDSSAVYFTTGMNELYNSGKTVADITGIDPSYTSATVVNTQLYNDNNNAIVTVQLDYANGSQTVDVTLERQDEQWRVAAIAAQPQK